MIDPQPIMVVDQNGVRGTVVPLTQPVERDEPYLQVRLESGQQVLVPVSALSQQEDGTYRVPVSLTEFDRKLTTATAQPGTVLQAQNLVIPVVAEELQVEKQQVETGRVRVTKTVQERQEIINETLMHEELDVQRVPVNRYVNGPLPVRQEGDTMIIPLLEEVLVVEKRLVLKEEIHVSKRVYQANKPQKVVLRSEQAHIERIDPATDSAGGGT